MKFSERAAGVVIFATSLALSAAYLFLRQDSVAGGGFFFRDFAFFIHVADQLKNGEQLYRDIFWQYGPLPVVPFAWLANFTGVSPFSYLAMEGVIILLNIQLIFLLLKRHLPVRTVVVLMLLVIVPYMVRLVAGAWVFLPLETTLLLVLALCWRPVEERTVARALLLGALLGLMQYVKFGVAQVAGVALIVVDLIEISRAGWGKTLTRWLKNCSFILLAFVVLDLIRAALVWRVTTPAQAMDVIWPSFMLDHYKNNPQAAERYPSFETWGIFFGTQLPGLVWLLLGIYGIWLQLRRAKNAGTSPAALNILVVFYLIGLPVLFKHRWLIYMHFGLLAVPACWVMEQLARPARWLSLLLLAPAAIGLPYKIFLQPAGTEAVLMPNRQKLWLNAEEEKRVQGLFSALEAIPNRSSGAKDPIMVFNAQGSGVHFFGGYPHATRHVWFLPNFVRPYEEAEVFGALSQVKAIVVFASARTIDSMTADPVTWKPEDWSPFDRSRDAALLQRLAPPVKVDARWLVFPVKR